LISLIFIHPAGIESSGKSRGILSERGKVSQNVGWRLEDEHAHHRPTIQKCLHDESDSRQVVDMLTESGAREARNIAQTSGRVFSQVISGQNESRKARISLKDALSFRGVIKNFFYQEVSI
jgi:hypothetical protein